MLHTDQKIVVTSPSFCKNLALVEKVKQYFSNIHLNEQGSHYSKLELINALKTATGAIIGTEKITEKILSHCPHLKIISKYGVGLDNIDLNALKKKNIKLHWVGGVNKISVAELTLSFMLGLIRNTYFTSLNLKNGEWNKDGGNQLSGKTIGIVGIGHIGKEVIRLLEPFHCQILVNDILNQDDYCKQHNLIFSTKEEVFSKSDIITIHIPLYTETHHLINYNFFKKMKKNAFFINTSRGEIIVQDDLKRALKEKLIQGAAVDVYETEPPTDIEFLNFPNLYCTPHIGGNAQEAVLAMGISAIEGLTGFFTHY